ncbi:hypothetical protein FHS31_000816 [Sphingomonas vulcanisoli]|uniref:Uncharacterized protein n=1 Tax=Sphingomonas vulcanisoli TaxID=1658060 RepID=A0ABX0TRQ3_9SPHN|nr:hypothetical protein [Sphingomonas vulcanisoli]NIJ07220.1 hypothetical protein [Sphingomonas vulcanisoli]
MIGWSRFYAGRFYGPEPDNLGVPWGEGHWSYSDDSFSHHLIRVADLLEALEERGVALVRT